MNEQTLTPDDPRLTAFALGELDGAEAMAIAAAVAADPLLTAAVEEIRATMLTLEDVLAAEPVPAVNPIELPTEDYPLDSRKVVRFPYFWVSGLMAAGFAVLVVVHDPESPVKPQEEVLHYEVNLSETVSDETSADAMEMAPLDSEVDTREERPTDGVSSESVATMGVARSDESTEFRSLDEALRMADGTVSLPTVLVEISREQAESAQAEQAMKSMGLTSGDKLSVGSSGPVSSPPTTPTHEPGANAVSYYASVEPAPSSTDGYTRTLRTRSLAMTNRIMPATNQLMLMPSPDPLRDLDASQEGYAPITEAAWQRVGDHPVSTFSIDVDTGSYANVRRFINSDQLPPVDAVRIEEMINAFSYNYPAPAMGSDAPFAASLEVASAPWAPEHRLVRIGLKGRDIAAGQRAPANLVFLLDVSGSMRAENKLPLVKEAMRLLVGQLQADDRVAIVTYAGTSGLALPSTPATQRRAIIAALDRLQPAGGTNGAMGIHLAYDIAKANFVTGGINRVILCTDGDFNVGPSGQGDLGRLITEKAESDVFLTTLGFGMGNYQDQTLERLADMGNGSYGYIDSPKEARRLLVEQVNGTLATIAKDVKIQVEFNPALVESYRLIGYENRALAKEDFANDQVDAGEIGAGHTVTALYEIVPVGGAAARGSAAVSDDLRYQTVARSLASEVSHELLTVKVRAKAPDQDASRRWDFPLVDQGAAFATASADFKFATAVAGFGMVLRDSTFLGATTLRRVLDWGEAGMDYDPAGYRAEFIELVRRAEVLQRQG
ncbi:vWA domain-containing protein [Synoicihabitans lomoniglobus]|uniref:VWA domain-containing protein n=1 Tax=Synoicihabitans lomoniglobus TaxID=2909285 RepID=A0AAF0CNN7_9BACT|nr:VWA domain-containing protein [Opitutaceae bacterium LMO-M01]WED64761.1 VWA domain-containing protein [Opitutaceae bacterium LMO-M01]